MVSKYALLDSQGKCVNIVLWDGTSTVDFAGLTAVPYDPTKHVISADPRVLNRAAITDKALAALTTNTTFLAIANPTTAQVTAQVKALTRECSALIRLLLDQLDDTSGT